MEVAGAGIELVDMRRRWTAGSLGARLLSIQNPLVIVGLPGPTPADLGPPDVFMGVTIGSLTSLKARAPQLMRLASGLVGLPLAGSLSSTAESSIAEDEDETDETDPRLMPKVVEN